MIRGNIRGKHAPEMPGGEDDDMIVYLAPDSADEPLAVGMLPRAVERTLDLFSTQVLDP